MISDDDVEKALDYLRDKAHEIGQAKEASYRADKMLGHHKALAMKLSGESGVTAQEREALSSEQYVMAIERAAVSAGEYESMKALREAAALKIEVYRTVSANYRSMKIG